MIGAAAEIKSRVSMRDVLSLYGVEPNRHGRCACPIHHGKDPNMVVRDKSFHCYVCGAGGTVLDFVMQCDQVSLDDAERKLNDALHLGLPLDKTQTETERSNWLKSARKRIEVRQIKEKRIQDAQNAYETALTRFTEMDKTIQNAVQNGNIDLTDDVLVYAIKHIDEASIQMDEAWDKLMEAQYG